MATAWRSGCSAPASIRLRLSRFATRRQVGGIRLYRSQLGPLVIGFGRWFDDPEVAGSELYWELDPAAARRPVWQLLKDALPAESRL